MNKFIILDRDGVINYDSDDYIKTPAEWIAIENSIQAIALLTKAGFTITVASNQSGIGRGYYNEATLALIHEKMYKIIQAAGGNIADVFYCPHITQDNCDCRKPKPGLLLQIQEKYQIDLTQVVMVGDKLSDIQAALAVGVKPILVKTGKGKKTLAKYAKALENIAVYDDLLDYVDNIKGSL